MTITRFLETKAKDLPRDSFPHPRQTIRHLIESLTGLSQIAIHLNPDKKLLPKEQQLLETAVSSLKRGVPLAYVLSEVSFLEWTFKIDKRAFIPRPETEALCAMVRECVPSSGQPQSILDMCCGSGIMGLSMALSFPDANLVLADISKEALSLAKENTLSQKLESRVSLIHTDLWADIPSKLKFDLMVCNPPYVADDEHVDAQVLEYEPKIALFSEENGLQHTKILMSRLDGFLNPGGLAAFELGHHHADTFDPWIKAQKWHGSFTWEKDPFGVPRFLFYRKEKNRMDG